MIEFACVPVCIYACMHYLTNKSGCAKKSAYISNNERLSRMKVGRTTCAQEAGKTVKLAPCSRHESKTKMLLQRAAMKHSSD